MQARMAARKKTRRNVKRRKSTHYKDFSKKLLRSAANHTSALDYYNGLKKRRDLQILRVDRVAEFLQDRNSEASKLLAHLRR